MSNSPKYRILGTIVAGALAGTLALASPALARGGHGGGGGGGGHGGGGGWGMHSMGAMAMHPMGMGGGMGPHWSGAGWHHGHFVHFHHHHFRRLAFIGAPYFYASDDYCWRRVWTPYGLQLVNVCGDYGY